MEQWQKNQLQEMQFIDCERDMFKTICEWSAELGFVYCSFAMRSPLPVTNPAAMAIANYPEALQQAYQHSNYVNIDPVVQHALSSVDMLTWTVERFSRVPEVMHEALAAGIGFGVSQPTRGHHGVAGLLSLSRSAPAVSASELEDKKVKLTWLANIAHQRLSRYLISNFMTAVETKLSSREISVLRWTAEGKTSDEIAAILNITKRTVDFHINNAVAKLGAPNRTAATVQAAVLGLL
jgi:LuxR family transcriptional regulator